MVDECTGKGLEGMACGLFELLPINLAGKTEENYEKLWSRQLVFYLRF
jgi:hypothetical protein